MKDLKKRIIFFAFLHCLYCHRENDDLPDGERNPYQLCIETCDCDVERSLTYMAFIVYGFGLSLLSILGYLVYKSYSIVVNTNNTT